MPTAIYGVSHYGDPFAVYGKAQPEPRQMAQDNLSTMTMPSADKTAILAAIATLATAVQPYMVNIPAADKKKYAIIGTARAGMDEVFIRSMTDNPGLIPNYVVLADVNVDRQYRVDVKDVVAEIQPLVEGLLDSELLANSDNYLAYLAYYNNVKMAAKRNVPGADTELAKLTPFFPTGRRQPAPATPS